MEPRRAATTNITAVSLPRHFDAGPTSTPACQPANLLASLSANQPTASFNPNAAAAAQVLRNEKKRLEGERSKCYITNLCPPYHIARLKNYMSV